MKLRHAALFVTGVAVAALLLGEALIWVASPTECMYPRYQFSPEYGLIPFPNVTMVHRKPRHYRFEYTVGSDQCRGEIPSPAEASHPVVAVLGDSYTFGMGVSDGDEYGSVMQRELGDRATVINLGGPGWGLTQQARRFVELGESYDPEIVILQFCANDPDDNLLNRVTRVEDGELVFVESSSSLNLMKKYLSRSFVQRTQLYNFLRGRASRIAFERAARRDEAQLPPEAAASTANGTAGAGPTPIERVYGDLLDAFARRLHDDGRTLIVIAVDRQLESYPGIRDKVAELDERGLLRYVEVLDFLSGHEPYDSAEGHLWGATAHQIVGDGLAGVVARLVDRDDPTAGRP
jgi:hypothetical protein